MPWHLSLTGKPIEVSHRVRIDAHMPPPVRNGLLQFLTLLDDEMICTGETHGHVEGGRGNIVVHLETRRGKINA